MQVWNEKGELVDISVLKEGYLVKVTFDAVDLDIRYGNPLWIYRGVSSHPELLLFDTPGNLTSRGRACFQNRETIRAGNIQLLEMVAIEPHAVLTIFNAWGAAKTECTRLKQAISNATAHLTGV